MMKVRKRDGRYADFDAGRIRNAVNAARCEVKSDDLFLLDIVVNDVVSRCHDGISVEEIQDLVEGSLMAYGKPEVAKAYILYRDKRTKARSSASDQIIADIIAAKKNDVTRENANMNTDTPAGMMMKIASERSKEHVVNYLLSQDTLDLMSANILHVHDMDYYPTRSLTCVQSPVDKLLNGGFKAGHGESRPAKRIETASILACISLETTQNEQHGGQAIPAFDFYLAPFVRLTYIEEVKKAESLLGRKYESLYHKDIPDYIPKEEPLDCKSPSEENVLAWAINQTVCRVHQAMEAFIHNMNTIHSRGGNQVVFSSLNYGTDTSAEGRCIIRELLKCTYQGVGNGSTAIFPIQIWKKKRGVNYLPGDPNYDLFQLACKVTAKRFFPNFLNLDATFNRSEEWKADDPKRYEHEVATMGCVDGQEVVTWRIDGEVNTLSIRRFWKQMARQHAVHDASEEGFEGGKFIDLTGVEILDNGNFVECLRVIKNPDKGDWMKVTLSNGICLTVTSDHPWTVNGEIVLTKDLRLSRMIPLDLVQLKELTGQVDDEKYAEVTKIEWLGFRDRCSYDVTTSSEHFTVSGVRSHNCRTRIFEDRFGRKTSIGRGNLSFSTINLPGLALSVMEKPEEERIEEFFTKLENAIKITGKQLHERYEFQCTALAKQFPLLMSGMWMESENLKPNDEVREVLKHGTLGVGFIGLAECLIALCGHHHGESEEAQELGLRIIRFMKERVAELSDEYDLNYSVFATPAEGLSGKFTKKDRAKYGIVKGVTDKDYYTNSNHVPVYYHCSADHKARVEAPYHELTRGGHIFYVEMDGDATHNVEAIHDIVRLVDKYDIGYASVNHNRNRCLDCGYEDASKDLTTCPECGSHRIDKLQRITGYLVGTTDRWNSGKLAELKDRVTHD